MPLAAVLAAPLSALAFVGRYGTQGFALSIVLGLALPELAAAFRPLLPATIFLFIVVTFARTDLSAIRALVRRPAKLIAACAWLIAAPIALVVATIAVLGPGIDPGLRLGLALLGAAPPLMSAPAVAIIYRFEPSLIIASVVVVTILSPLIAPPVAELLAGGVVPLDATALALRLVAFVGGGTLVGLGLRRLAGPVRLARHGFSLDGVGVVLYFVFAVATMDGVAAAALARPATVGLFLAIAIAISLASLAAGLALMRFLPAAERFMLGYGAGQRNMGLLIAVLGAGVPEATFLFFALAQVPIYLMPLMLAPLARRMRAPPPGDIRSP